eukprot:gene24404-29501_t
MSDTPFDVIMQQAFALKTAQMAVDRKAYDSYPTWLRNSLFSTLDIIETRQLSSFQAKYNASMALKHKGNELLQAKDNYAAISQFEKALSVWQWLESRLKNWKQSAIKDEDLTLHEYTYRNGEEKEQVQQLRASCILNISLAYLNMQQHQAVIDTTSYLLAQLPMCPAHMHTKALYRRALAYAASPSATLADKKRAQQDLRQALRLCNNTDKVIARAYQEITQEIVDIVNSEKKLYTGVFDKDDKDVDSIDIDSTPVNDAAGAKSGGGSELGYRDVAGMLEKLQSEIDSLEITLRYHSNAHLKEEKGEEEAGCGDVEDVRAKYNRLFQRKEKLMGILQSMDTAIANSSAVHSSNKSNRSAPTSSSSMVSNNSTSQSMAAATAPSSHHLLPPEVLAFYKQEATELIDRIFQDHTPAQYKDMLACRLKYDKCHTIGESDTGDDGEEVDLSNDEDVHAKLQSLLLNDYVNLYIRFYQKQVDGVFGDQMEGLGGYESVENDESKKAEEESRWVEEVFKVLQ